MDNRQANVQYMRVSELVGARRNPHDHDIGEIREAYRRWGYVMPMLMNEATGRLVAGHGRRDTLMGMKAQGKDAPYGVVVDEAGEWLVPVIRGISFDSEEEAEAYLLADNRLVEMGGWKDDELVSVLSDLMGLGEDMLVGTGFDADDVDRMIEQVFGDKLKEETDGEDEESEDSDYDGLVEKYGIELHTVVKVGDHTIMCGDCRDDGTWQMLAGNNSINGIVTSPPYAEQRAGDYVGIPQSQYVEWWDKVQRNANAWLADDGSFFVNIKPHVENGERVLYVHDLVNAMVLSWHWCFIDEYCWERTAAPGSWPNRFKNGFEPVYHFAKGIAVKFRPDNVRGDTPGSFERHAVNKNTGEYFNTNDTYFEWDGALPSNRIAVKENATRIGHVAAYPWKLPAFFVEAFSDRGDVWLDPFCGSGSTLIACENTGRIGLGIEIEPKYVAITVDRLATLTGEEPRILK